MQKNTTKKETATYTISPNNWHGGMSLIEKKMLLHENSLLDNITKMLQHFF